MVLIIVSIAGFLLLPTPKIEKPDSTVVLSAENQLLGARIAADGQWRFPPVDSLPENYKTALLAFEDRWFYYHWGINPVSIIRAVKLNIKHGRVVSGGSTISMQVARLSRNNPPRNVWGKFYEMLLALKLELFKSKDEILCTYASAAPFGGNVVGIEAAAWRYFGRQAFNISWAEAVTLAVLPNSPSLIYPGKNQQLLKEKRNKLLHKLLITNKIDSVTYLLSLQEELPPKPLPLPNIAQHVCEQLAAKLPAQRITTTIEYKWQQHLNRIVDRHHQLLRQNYINNMAALLIEVKTGNILAYVGNTDNPQNLFENHVDITTRPRSSGSILKPFLYASMLHNGEILPNMLIRDIPVNFAGYSPKNFDFNYSGAVPADKALVKSLNVPAVEMLHQFGENRFLDVLRQTGFTTFNQPASHYGLSLILGGAEVNLLELAGTYASMARVLNNYNLTGNYKQTDYFVPSFLAENQVEKTTQNSGSLFSAASVWFTFEALREVSRPEERAGWWNFSSSGNVAWKTGTSFGFRDAWAVGVTPLHVVAVWAGNATGEGRAGLTGSKAAGPVLFDVLDLLTTNTWFEKPVDELTTAYVCTQSGHIASNDCPDAKEMEIPVSGLKTTACPYHKIIHLSNDSLWRVNASCYPVAQMVKRAYFVLPPAMEWYYRKTNPGYQSLPLMHKNCTSSEKINMIELLYPRNTQTLFVPNDMDGSRGEIVFEAAHRQNNAKLFWYIDNQFLGKTQQIHQMGISPLAGKHTLLIIDEKGNTFKSKFEIK